MDCINCGSGKNVSILKGIFICDHCNELNYIDYYKCEECGETWKVVDLNSGIVESISLASHSKVFKEGVSDSFGEIHVDEEACSDAGTLMTDYIHKCLMCNTVSYEKNENTWHCPECGFEWETVVNS